MKLFCSACQKVFEAEKPQDSSQVKCPSCGAEQEFPQTVPGPGVVLGDFLIEKLLSRGGMGEVFLAKQISLDRPVALKVLQQKHLEDKEYVESLFKEARAAAKLNHPNIVQAYAIGEDNGIFYFAMEYIRGETFKQILKREKTIEFTRAATVIRDIARALSAAWREQKLVHQDIKPDNIMLDANGFAKLADLGLAKVAGGNQEDAAEEGDEVLGTPQYISPEQLTGVPTDVRSDIYSLGATFYHFVTGRFPYVADTGDEIARMHLECALQPPREVNPKLPEALNRIIVKMMEKDINKRYQTAESLIDDLDAYLRSAPPSSGGKKAVPAAKPAAKPAVPPKKPTLPKLSVPGKSMTTPPKPTVPKLTQPNSETAPEPPKPSPAAGNESAKPAAPSTPAPPPTPAPTPEPESAETDEPSRFSRPLKITLTVVAGVLLLAVIAVAALVICHKYEVLPAALTPVAKPVAQFLNFGSSEPKKVKPAVKKPAPPPKPVVVLTRPEYLATVEKLVKMPTASEEQQDKFLKDAEMFMTAFKPQTVEERTALRRLIAVYAPVDESRRFVPYRSKTRSERLQAIADAKRKQEEEKRKQEELARKEREDRERREQERQQADAERRKFKEENERRIKARTELLKKDIGVASMRLVNGFYAAVNGDQKAFDSACEAAKTMMQTLPSVNITATENKLIDGFKELYSRLPEELEKVLDFKKAVTDMKDDPGFRCRIPDAGGGLCRVVTLNTDGSLLVIHNGKSKRLPSLGRDRLSFDRTLTAYLKENPHALFYYGLMTKQFDNTMKKDVPNDFWKKYLVVFITLTGGK
jgi:serine/threonine protein kinase